MWSMGWIYVDKMSDLCWIECWVCVDFLWIICRIYVDYMSNRCWTDVEYIQSRVEANQWTLGFCLSRKVTPVGARLRDDGPLLDGVSTFPRSLPWSPIVSPQVCLCSMVRPSRSLVFPCLPLSPCSPCLSLSPGLSPSLSPSLSPILSPSLSLFLIFL